MTTSTDDAARWRRRAEYLRAHAEKVSDSRTKDTLKTLAESCDQLARQVEARTQPILR